MARPGRMAQGDFGEDARMNQHKADGTPAFDMNKIERYALARNAPTIDISTSETFESVKATGNVDKALGHLCDMQASESWESSTERGVKAKFAQTIVDNAEMLQKEGAWPKDLPNDANAQEVTDFMRDKGKLVLPTDTADAVIEALPEAVSESPGPWGVDESLDPASDEFEQAVEQRVSELKERVVDFGEKYEACEKWAENHAEPVPGDGGSQGDLALPQPELAAEPAESASQNTPAEPAQSASYNSAAEPTGSGSHGQPMSPVQPSAFEPPSSGAPV